MAITAAALLRGLPDMARSFGADRLCARKARRFPHQLLTALLFAAVSCSDSIRVTRTNESMMARGTKGAEFDLKYKSVPTHCSYSTTMPFHRLQDVDR